MAKPFAISTKTGAVVLASELGKYAIKTKSGESNKLKEESFDYRETGVKPPVYDPGALIDSLEMNTYHARCIGAKATDIGGLGCTIEPVGDNPSQENYKRIETFINNCFPLFEEIATREAYDKQTIGWGTLELIRYGNLHDSEPERLEHIPSHTVRIHKDENKYLQTWDGVKKIWFKRIGYEQDIDKFTGVEYPLGSLPPEKRATEMIFDISYTPKSSYYGAPDIIPAFKTLVGDNAAVEYNIYFFKNFGIPDYAIFIMGDFEDEEIKDADGNPTGRSVMQEMIEDQMQDVINNPHSTMVISIPSAEGKEGGKVEVRFEKLTVDVKESSFRLYRIDNRDEIVTAHKVDPYRIGILPVGSLGGNLGSETKKNYKTTAVIPNQRLLEQYISIFIIQSETGFNIQDWKIKLTSIDTEDEKHDMAIGKEAFSMGAMTPNQVIRKWKDKLGLEEVDHPAMNAHYVNGQPIDYQPEAPVPGDVIKALKDLKSNLLEVAEKYET